ncbi:hypothetical protein HY622_01405 [Candidatus Uhrbacteria bacterium]|nr:hypothetical protein [Candidatus Uhrbacteria bacterium]
MKKKNLSISIGAIIVLTVAIAVLEFALRYVPLKFVPLDEMQWARPPGLVAVKGVEREGQKNGTLFIRLKDGKEQFVYEGWDVTFSDYGSAFAFQKKYIPPANSPYVLYYIEDGRNVTKLTIENSGGYIKDMQENPLRTYLFAEIVKNNASTFCILERVPSNSSADKDQKCLELGISDVERGLWNPNHERELVVKTTSRRIFTLDPWEKRPRQIYAEGDTKQAYEVLLQLFQEKPSDISSYYDSSSKKQFFQLPFATIIMEGRGLTLLPLSADTKLSWVDDGHLLAKGNDSLDIIEYKTGRTANLFNEKETHAKAVLIHIQRNDIEL